MEDIIELKKKLSIIDNIYPFILNLFNFFDIKSETVEINFKNPSIRLSISGLDHSFKENTLSVLLNSFSLLSNKSKNKIRFVIFKRDLHLRKLDDPDKYVSDVVFEINNKSDIKDKLYRVFLDLKNEFSTKEQIDNYFIVKGIIE